MGTPDSDWIMKERPWYKDGLKADNVTLGEMYLDADSGKYIVSVFADENVTEEKSVFESSDPLDQKLADQSNNSVTEIQNTTANIQNTMDALSKAFVVVEQVAGDMAASTEEQTASTTMVMTTCEELKGMSDDFNQKGKDLDTQSSGLKDLSQSLETQVKQFTC